MMNDVGHLFICKIAIYLLMWSVQSNLLPVFKLGCLFIELKHFQYILEINPLSVLYEISPHLWLAFFIFLTLPFEEEKFLILVKTKS